MNILKVNPSFHSGQCDLIVRQSDGLETLLCTLSLEKAIALRETGLPVENLPIAIVAMERSFNTLEMEASLQSLPYFQQLEEKKRLAKLAEDLSF
jgi:hypothetical protein